MKTTTIRLPKPHSPGQQEMLDWPRHGVAFCGRRWGKTEIACVRLLRGVVERPGLYWWVGLSWRSASMKRAWRLLRGYCALLWRAVGERPDKHIRESEKELIFPGGGMIWLRTAERPDSLAGEGVAGVVLDEFSLMNEAVWVEYIAATLVDHGGWALFVGVPKGLNWATRLWQAAKTRPGWKAWQFTSYDNPHLDPKLIDELASGLPERLRRQEIYAEIVDDSGAVFRNVAAQATATPQERWQQGHVYVVGVDWARTHDATVFSVIDVTLGEQCWMERLTGVDYERQVGLLKALNNRFRPSTILAESNAMGRPLIERLQRERLPIRPFTTTNSTKQAAIDALTMAFEREELRILADETQMNELMAFEAQTLPSGLIRYSAPEGLHDDTVIALALAWHAKRRPMKVARSYEG